MPFESAQYPDPQHIPKATLPAHTARISDNSDSDLVRFCGRLSLEQSAATVVPN